MEKDKSLAALRTAPESFWNERWENKQTGWDIGYASPALTQYIDGLEDKQLRILIPGCGNAYEATYLVEKGFQDIYIIDIAPLAVERAQQKFKELPQVKVIQGDFFQLEGTFDLILEQTFFCAIAPTLRPAYVKKMQELLSPEGVLAGLLFQVEFEKAGPPFGGSEAEYQALFQEDFDILRMETCYNSIPPRAGSELFIWMAPKKESQASQTI